MNRFRKIVLAVAVVMLMLSSALVLMDPEEIEVEAAQSPSTDSYGYTWIDNKGNEPLVDYDYIDITSTGTKITSYDVASYYSYYQSYYYGYKKVSLPFAFPYYGNSYNDCYLGIKGVLGFDNAASDQYFRYWSYSYDIPNRYTPDNTISVYNGYAMGFYHGVGGMYYQSGVASDGRQYFIAQWYRVSIYYYYAYRYGAAYTLDFQVILYDDGSILCQYKDTTTSYSTSYSTGDGAIAGIENTDGTDGLQYSRDKRGAIPAGHAILYKNYKTDISNVTFKPGYGIDENIYPAQGGKGDEMYWAEADIWIETDVDDLTKIEMTIGPGTETENIMFRYNFETENFQKLNDGYRMMVLDEQRSAVSYNQTDPTHRLTIKFFFDFNLNWLRLDLIDVNIYVEGSGVKSTLIQLNDVFRVETRMQMVGNLTITDFKGRELERGDWVKGGDTITFTGVERRYADPSIPIMPPDNIKIGIADETGLLYTSEESPDLMNVKVYVPAFYSDLEYWFVFINVTENNDMSDPYYKGFRFLVQIDSDNPGLPGELVIRPDSFDDQAKDYDDDPDIYLSWKDAVDQSSGVAMYHISVNKDKEEAKALGSRIIDIQKGTLTALVDNLEEGVNTLYIWAEDDVGNEGNSIFIDVIIDLTPVYFSDFYPVTGEWINTLRPRTSIVIHDDLTGVDPLTIEYEISTSGEVGLVGEWNTISDAYAPGEELRVVVEGWFKNGKDNWIHFRAKDMAGNGYVESESYNVWVDAKSPTYKLLSHSEDEYQLNPLQEVRVQILDEQSWVDASSIEYRISTQGLTKWSQWLPYKDASDGPKPVVTLREHFRRGSDNYVQVRAMDLAGNPISASKAFNIRINTSPEIVVVSPSSGDILKEDEVIIFDASDSYDMDGDRLTISWYKSTPTGLESLGDAPQVSARLPAGEHTITVTAKDRVNNEVQFSFTITVEKTDRDVIPPTQDTDGDGMFDVWEIQFQTDPNVKDAQLDHDKDGFTNFQEFENNTNPWNEISKPAVGPGEQVDESLKLFSTDAWPLWVLLVVLLVAVLLTMFVAKGKKDRQVKRLQTVRNMRKIMPSVSWDQITTTAYMAPMTGGPTLPAAAGPALPSAGPSEVPPDQALPPAQAAEANAEQAPAPAPEPSPAPAPAPAPEPTPAQPMQAAPAGTVPQPETPPIVDKNLPPQPEQ
ncbi:MAG: hypothetical protein ACMUHU_05435 [Thermoplasmatota archaeon]